MFYTEDHQTTATENKMETESSSISGIQEKHKKTLIKEDCLSMLLNNFYPADKGNWQIINVLEGSWERCTGKHFKIKETFSGRPRLSVSKDQNNVTS